MKQTDNSELKALVKRVGEGDEAAFEAFLDIYEKRIFSFLYRMCGVKEDAEDGAQEVFLSALKALPEFRWEVPLLSWLFRIAANRCRSMRRRKSGQPVKLEPLDAAQQEGSEPAGKTPDPLEETVRLRREERLQEALAAMDKDTRMLIVLRDLQGLSTRETAQILGMNDGAVKTGLHRARNRLKEAMNHEPV